MHQVKKNPTVCVYIYVSPDKGKAAASSSAAAKGKAAAKSMLHACRRRVHAWIPGVESCRHRHLQAKRKRIHMCRHACKASKVDIHIMT